MLGDRLIATGGAKLVGALAVACLVLAALLVLSVTVNVYQVRGKAKAVGDVLGRLAVCEATGAADLASAEAINTRANAAVSTLETELLQCLGAQQKQAEQLELAQRQRARARDEISELEMQRRTIIEGIAKTHENDCNRPLCRALSDELLGTPADRQAE